MSKVTRELKNDIVQIFNECVTEDLTNKLCSRLLKQIDKKLEAVNVKLTKIDNMEDKIINIDSSLNKLDKLDDVSKQVADLNILLANLNSSVNTNQKSIANLNKTWEQTQQYNKRNSLRFYGFGESEGENSVEVIVTFVTEKLNICCTARDIDCAFRIGKNRDDSRCRIILVNFVNNWMRTEIVNRRKMLKSSGISIFEDLTKMRYEVLASAKQKYGKKNVWSAGGRVFAYTNGKKITITGSESE